MSIACHSSPSVQALGIHYTMSGLAEQVLLKTIALRRRACNTLHNYKTKILHVLTSISSFICSNFAALSSSPVTPSTRPTSWPLRSAKARSTCVPQTTTRGIHCLEISARSKQAVEELSPERLSSKLVSLPAGLGKVCPSACANWPHFWPDSLDATVSCGQRLLQACLGKHVCKLTPSKQHTARKTLLRPVLVWPKDFHACVTQKYRLCADQHFFLAED